MPRITLMNAEWCVFQRAKIHEALRMLFSSPVLMQTRKSPGHYSAIPALASALEKRTGVRQLPYSEEGGTLRIWINGRRFVGRGGNWGFPETNLRFRGREYERPYERKAAIEFYRLFSAIISFR